MIQTEILELLGKEISPNEYETYIKCLKFNAKSSNDENIIYEAPNEFVAKYIHTKYSQNLEYLFELKSGKKAKIFINSPRQKNIKKAQINEINSQKIQSSPLNPSFTFENFIVGNSNQYAYFSAEAVAKNLGDNNYNPLFIYGPTGLGKTHLLQSIGNFCLKNNKIVIYVTSENFITDFVYNLHNKTMNKFREKYRNCDVLLIDDVQFLGRTDQIQDEFFHTFNELYSKNGQIVMTSDRKPKMLKNFTDRLRSRFESKLLADITPPELETKIAIIKKKCEFDGIYLNEDVINYIATNMGDNIREIESAIINLNAYAKMLHQDITLEFAKNVMRDQIKEKKDNITIENIVEIISKELNVKPSEIKSKSRKQNIVEARRIGIYLAKNLTPNSMPQLANFFGMKDHSAVSKNIKKIYEIIQSDEYFKIRIEELKNLVLKKEN